jgi:hypothetical protein
MPQRFTPEELAGLDARDRAKRNPASAGISLEVQQNPAEFERAVNLRGHLAMKNFRDSKRRSNTNRK